MVRIGSLPSAAAHVPAAVMDYDEVADWLPKDVAALSLHPVAYAPDAADGAVPIVTVAEFTRWTSARAANDANGTWAGTVAVEGDTMEWTQDEYRLTEPPACFPLDKMTADGTPCYRIVGMGMVCLTDATTARCASCYEAAHGYDPDMGDDFSTFAPGVCPACGLDATVFTPDPILTTLTDTPED